MLEAIQLTCIKITLFVIRKFIEPTLINEYEKKMYILNTELTKVKEELAVQTKLVETLHAQMSNITKDYSENLDPSLTLDAITEKE